MEILKLKPFFFTEQKIYRAPVSVTIPLMQAINMQCKERLNINRANDFKKMEKRLLKCAKYG